jgi:hypothetical protein
MVCPVRSAQASNVSTCSGAEPEMNSRMRAHAARVRLDSPSMRVYSVGTPMNTVASSKRVIVALGSKRENQIILLPLSKAPCDATNSPCTWKIGSAWISTSPCCQPQ